MVNMNACKNATNISIKEINNDNTNDIPVDATGPKAAFIVIIKAIKLITTKCGSKSVGSAIDPAYCDPYWEPATDAYAVADMAADRACACLARSAFVITS